MIRNFFKSDERSAFPLAFTLVLALVPGLGLAEDRVQRPEATSAIVARRSVSAREIMIATAHPLATEAGLAILEAGGSAADAAVAVQMMLSLVEPQNSGLGGGAFLVHWDAETATLSAGAGVGG